MAWATIPINFLNLFWWIRNRMATATDEVFLRTCDSHRMFELATSIQGCVNETSLTITMKLPSTLARPPTQRHWRTVCWSIAVLSAGFSLWPATSDGQRITLKIETGSKSYIGRPVSWNDQQFIMLRRDGRMLQFDMNEVADFEKQSDFFTPYSASKVQRHLQSIFKDRYEVSRTAHYVVVHPPGMRSRWAEPFERLFGRFSHYFAVRGFSQSPTEFPLVVVVFRSRGEFNAVASQAGMDNPNGYVGFYSPKSNWIVTYQQSANKSGGPWDSNHLTLIHEALHQYAFNRGIHNRWSPTPKWCAEGLASMFETRGVNHSMKYTSKADRIHAHYLQRLKLLLKKFDSQELLKSTVANDRAFSNSPEFAYPLAWGVCFYLAETRTGEFNRYLQRIAARPALTHYPSSDRLADFARHFGSDYRQLESQFRRFMAKQP